MKKKIVLEMSGIEIHISNPVTIATLVSYNDERIGIGVRKHGDEFSPYIGAKMAMKSLMKKLEYRRDRIDAWDEFFAHPWVVKQMEIEKKRRKEAEAEVSEKDWHLLDKIIQTMIEEGDADARRAYHHEDDQRVIKSLKQYVAGIDAEENK